MDTRELIERSTQGDEVALVSLLAEQLPAVLAFVRLNAGELVLAHESVSDVVQSVCREVLESDLASFEFRGEAAFRNWLFTRAVHTLNNRRRRLQAKIRDVRRNVSLARPELHDGVAALYATIASPSQDAVAAETARRLEVAFAQLSDTDRQIISMSRIVGFSHAEIGAELGIREAAVRVRLHRALARLGTRMHVGGDD